MSDFFDVDLASGTTRPAPEPDPTTVTILTHRIADLPHPAILSTRQVCGECGEAVWLADRPMEQSLFMGGAAILCFACLPVTPEIILTSADQLREVAERAVL